VGKKKGLKRRKKKHGEKKGEALNWPVPGPWAEEGGKGKDNRRRKKH